MNGKKTASVEILKDNGVFALELPELLGSQTRKGRDKELMLIVKEEAWLFPALST